MGEAAGDVTKHITAYNNGVAGTLVDIRSDDANLVYNTTAQSLEVVSSDVNDDFIPTGTLTLSSAVANTFADGDITCASVLAADTVTVNGLLYTAVSGARSDDTEFSIDTGDNECATDLAAAITADTRSGTTGDVTATSSTDTVTATTDVEGTAGNAITLVSSNGTRLAVTGSGNFTGGVAADVATVNGLTFTGVAGTKADNTEFSIDTSDTAAALDLKLSINADTRTPITVPTVSVTATSAVGVVTINALTGGTAGNTIDTVGTANITAGAATLVDQDTAGAWTVTVEGLDANFEEQSETVNLNGQIANALTNTYIFVQRMYILTAGTGGVNEGVITCRIASGGATQLTMAINDNESQSANFIVPANRKAELIRVICTLGNDPSVVNSNQLEIYTKDLATSDSTFRLKDTIGVPFRVTTDYEDGEFELGSKTSLNFKSIRPLGAVDNKVNLQYTLKIHQA